MSMLNLGDDADELDKLQQRLFQLETLYEIGRESAGAQDMTGMLGVILPMVMGAFGAVSGAAFVGRADGKVEALATRGTSAPQPQKSPHEWASTMLPAIHQHAQQAAAEGADQQNGFDLLASTVGDVGLTVGIPIEVDDTTYGALAVGKRLIGEAYDDDRALLERIINNVVPYLRNVKLLESLRGALESEAAARRATERAQAETAVVLARSVEARDPYTQGHAERVSAFSVGIAMRLGLSSDERELITLAGRFHDVGKIGVRDAVLNKPGRLTNEEFDEIRQHPALSAQIITDVSLFREAASLIVAHHERLDGTGYPQGLKGDEFTVGARVLAVADVWDALTTDRSYRKGMPRERALDILETEAKEGLQDREVVKALVATLDTP
ncbi:MAG: hypothetical protein CL878_15050 [Dehalococcoidia bacterium]|nr:hypothetical protein [Dehalococcoidia bacterium]